MQPKDGAPVKTCCGLSGVLHADPIGGVPVTWSDGVASEVRLTYAVERLIRLGFWKLPDDTG